jgi:hypothetical protein
VDSPAPNILECPTPISISHATKHSRVVVNGNAKQDPTNNKVYNNVHHSPILEQACRNCSEYTGAPHGDHNITYLIFPHDSLEQPVRLQNNQKFCWRTDINMRREGVRMRSHWPSFPHFRSSTHLYISICQPWLLSRAQRTLSLKLSHRLGPRQAGISSRLARSTY